MPKLKIRVHEAKSDLEKQVTKECVRLGLDRLVNRGYSSRIVPTYGNYIEKHKDEPVEQIAKYIYDTEQREWFKMRGGFNMFGLFGNRG